MADVVRPSHGLAFQDLARRVYFSRSFSYFYAAMIILNIAILIWAIQLEKVNHSDGGFIALEVVAVLMLLAEILLRVVHQRRSFWKRRCWAVVDIGVALLSALSIFFFIGGPSAAEEVENLLATAVRALRYTAQGLRVLLLLKARDTRTRQGDGDISFTALTRSDSTEDDIGAAAGAGWEETVQRCYRTSIELLLDRCAAMPGGGGGRGDGSSGSSGGGGVGSGGCGDSSGRGSGGGDDGGGGLTLDSELWIASPLIGCGARGAPMDRAASAAAKALCELLLLEEAPTPPTTGASLTTAGTKTGPRTERMTRFRFVVQEQSHHDLLKQAIDRCLADADVIRH